MLDKLLDPHAGLMIWTIISFLVLVLLMKVFAWDAILGIIEAREKGLRDEREKAEEARAGAQQIQRELEERLANAQGEVKEIIAQANRDGEVVRTRLKSEAEKESKGLLDKTRAQLQEEKDRLVGELRSEVAALSVLAAERLIKKSVDEGVRKNVLDGFYKDLEKPGKIN
ncbi:MAG: F0F1 ATP synthase subunit B [Elusimicrobiota bacterium]